MEQPPLGHFSYVFVMFFRPGYAIASLHLHHPFYIYTNRARTDG